MLTVTFVDKTGSGLWAATAALYFTYVTGLSTARTGLLLALSGAVSIAAPPLSGLLADRVPLRPLLITVQGVRAASAGALLATGDFRLLLVVTSLGSLGDRSASVLTRLYATRIAGEDRSRYQAVNRTFSNIGWAVGGLAAAGALTAGSTIAYRSLLLGDTLSFVAAGLLTLRCTEPPTPSRVTATARSATLDAPAPPAPPAKNPWRDGRYLLYTASEVVLFFDDSVFKVGLPLWTVTATAAPHGLAPLLLVLNNVLVVFLQVPFARFGATAGGARRALLPLAAIYLTGALALAASTADSRWFATGALLLAATAFTLAEILHSTVSWELSVALAAPPA